MKPSLANKAVTESYCTTGQFAKRDRTYHKHCGPTAITNLVLTLRPDLANAPAQVFDEVAALGRRLLAYWNVGAGKWLGGTSDGLAGLYLRQALNRFDCGNVKVRFGGPATEGRVRAALTRGNIVYLEMHFHPKYRNHHLLLDSTLKKNSKRRNIHFSFRWLILWNDLQVINLLVKFF